MTDFQKGITQLVKSALTGKAAEMPGEFDWQAAYRLGNRHQLLPILYYGAGNSSLSPPPEIAARLEHHTYKAIAISQNQLFVLSEICTLFDENGIDYMQLKGSLLKFLYPKPEMRPMCDLDILIKTEQYDRIRPIMQGLGFTETAESNHELVWDKDGILHIELHKRLIPSYNKDYFAYYGDGWRLARPTDKSRFAMSDEDTFIYLFTHYAKHYRDAGIGIRHITDLNVYLSSRPELDKQYIEAELEKLQLLSFYENTLKTLAVWFDDAGDDEVADFITAKIFGSGSYGTLTSKTLSKEVKAYKSSGSKSGVRHKAMLEIIFMPYRGMVKKYPFLKKCPVLLPFMWVVRGVTALLFKKDSVSEKSLIIKVTTDENISAYQRELNFVGLDFNFKE